MLAINRKIKDSREKQLWQPGEGSAHQHLYGMQPLQRKAGSLRRRKHPVNSRRQSFGQSSADVLDSPTVYNDNMDASEPLLSH